MSFALAHQEKNRAANDKASGSAKVSSHQSNLAGGFHYSIILQRTVGNQEARKSVRSSTRFDFTKVRIQPKLKVNQPGDAYEQEADEVTEHVIRAPISVPALPNTIETADHTHLKSSINKLKDYESENLSISRKPSAAYRFETSDEVTTEINDIRSNRGSALDTKTRQFMESRFGYDFGRVRIHNDERAAKSSERVSALAYTLGNDIVFGKGQYQPNTAQGRQLLAHELTHVVQNDGTPSVLHRKEVKNDSDIQGKQDWTTADRKNNTQRWKDACLHNLMAIDSSQYVKIDERRDFYKWFYEYSASLGYETRWALAASLVARGAGQIAYLDVDHPWTNDIGGLANVELQGAMREGNQVIFDNVLPKLKKLIDGGPLKGKAALEWDMKILAEEQTLIQPMYSRISKDTVEQLDYISRKKRIAGIGAWWSDGDVVRSGPYNIKGTIPAFNQPNIQNIGDRWKYGMELGNIFAPGGTGFDPNTHSLPAVSADYQSGIELAKVDTRANLHKLDAWLNPHRVSRIGSGRDIQSIISSLSEFEKRQVLSDVSADGWAYSKQFAQFSFITDAMVRQALPSDPAFARAVAAFMARLAAKRKMLPVMVPGF